MTKYKILIVDDEINILNGLKAALAVNPYEINTAKNGLDALRQIKQQDYDLIISDIKMPKMDGLTFQDEALKLNPNQQIILLTAFGGIETAVEAMRRGAYDFLTKPVNLDKLEMIVKRCLDTVELKTENEILREQFSQERQLDKMVGSSPKMIKLFDRVKAIAATKSTVLIFGESGTGKELIASAIHNLSPRKNKPFIAVNCSALPENLLESELFGHEKGAFTGALQRKDGRFKRADKGTLFLDEIGELAPHIQVKLLRVIQERVIEPLGSTQAIPVDIRLVAATNKNLEEKVAQGSFREDLYYRLNVLKVESPPLRERQEDIPLLVSHFVQECCKELEKTTKTLSSGALKALIRYPWPGNVRELKNIIENLVVFSRKRIIELDEIPDNIVQPKHILSPKEKTINIHENEKMLIEEALNEAKFNKTAAAKLLGMSRRTIHRKIKEYGIQA